MSVCVIWFAVIEIIFVHSYPDLFREDVRKYFSTQYLLENFPGTTEDVMLWNDMNEPSVFNGPEITMPKGTLSNSLLLQSNILSIASKSVMGL